MILHVYVDEETEKRLRHFSEGMGRSIEDLAESAVAEVALNAWKQWCTRIEKENDL